MRKTTLTLAGLIIFLGIGVTVGAENVQNTEHARERLKNALQIREQMREIEKKTIDNDAELQGIIEQMKGLHEQMREKLDSKLANDAEYQSLKKQIKTMREDWKKGPERKPGEKPLPPPKLK